MNLCNSSISNKNTFNNCVFSTRTSSKAVLTKLIITENVLAATIKTDTTKHTYFLNAEKNDNFSIGNIENSTAIKINNTIIHNMYDVKKIFYKNSINSNIVLLSENNGEILNYFYKINDNDDIQDIYKLENTIYACNSKLISRGHTDILPDNSYNIILNSYSLDLLYNEISTIIYNKKLLKKYLKDKIENNINELQAKTIIDHASIKMKYNHLFEIPTYNRNDYDSGNFIANVFKTKNQYNSMYSMIHDDESLHNSMCFLSSCGNLVCLSCISCTCNLDYCHTNNRLIYGRLYVGIIVNNGSLFLKYYDNVSADFNGCQTNNSCQYNFKMQHIEEIKKINRCTYTAKTKSTLFSLNINLNTSLYNININDDEVNNIKRMLRSILNLIIPANSQIFKININI